MSLDDVDELGQPEGLGQELRGGQVPRPFQQGRMSGPLPLAEKSRRVVESLFMESHSLRGAHTLLGFMETSHRAVGLSPFDAFVMEWAALAISLHDCDKFFELAKKPPGSKKDALVQEWLQEEGRQNKQAIRPRFEADPVSYLVALADQLQDFGRMNYRPELPTAEPPLTEDFASLRLSYPCKAVDLEAEGAAPGMRGHVHFIFGGEQEQPFGTTAKGASKAAEKKIPDEGSELIFGPEGWLDHAGLFASMTVAVSHESTPKPLRSTRTAAPEAGRAVNESR